MKNILLALWLMCGCAQAQTALIPQVASDIAPAGVASASTEGGYNVCGAQLAWNAFDRSSTTEWVADQHPTGWLQYAFSAPVVAVSYSVTGWGICSASLSARAPRSWQLICQDTGVVLDTQVNITFAQSVARSFSVATPTSCSAYRLNITANNGDPSYVQVMELQLYDGPLAAKTLGCEGDSQTAVRLTVTDPLTWCAQLAARLGWNHVNFAVGGSTTQTVISRLPTDLQTHVDCWVIQIGANNAFLPSGSANYPPELAAPVTPPAPGTTVGQFQSDLVTIANMIRSANPAPPVAIPLMFMTPWPFQDALNRVQFQFYTDAMKDTAKTLAVPVIDAYGLAQGGVWWNYQNNIPAFYSTYYVDSQHPSAAAHAWEAAQFSKQRHSAGCAFN